MREDIWTELDRFLSWLHRLLHQHRPPHFAPAAPTQCVFLQGTFIMTQATITDVLPTTRQDGSPLAVADIGSITFQKASLAGSPPVLGAPVTLATNLAATGGLTPAQLTFVDTNALPGDSYTSFVTDAQGHIGAPSTAFVVPATASPPSAPTQTVTLA
jgi:hypothetical protein